MNEQYLLPTYRRQGYTPISGYSGVASHGEYGLQGEYGEPFTIAAVSIGGAALTGAFAYRSGHKKGKKKGKRQQAKKSKKHYTKKLDDQKKKNQEQVKRLQENAQAKQQELELTIAAREEERDRTAEHLRRQLQVTHFTDSKRASIGVADEDLKRLYSKERSQMLEEFVQTGTQASQEIEAIRLQEQGADVQGINWKLIVGAVAVLGGGAYLFKNKKKIFKKKKKK
tara:strand:- start:819 stop:1496 length:678 start_codon:yes stop_codon:yes gene_type:complete